jgi:hypothetical protein
MTRFSTLSAIVLTGAFATLLANLHTPQPVISRYDESQFDEKIQERIVCYCCFKSTLTTTLDLLAHGKISLEEARNRVCESALHYNPEYFKHIAAAERGTTPQEHVARNLIGHLKNREEMMPTLNVRIFALEIEFAEMQRRVDPSIPQS